ncbi:hypothetical protein AC578_5614 [Pseudocercospora eumusae]|uniref:Uncharacterized protein n=1 Tax=Pseudocercospora eumusae TaxID=321146 RepID=A0A139HT56_9PEZI|nr:hypothetical protein AC578_5614 [Pseudocercospora eumusae]
MRVPVKGNAKTAMLLGLKDPVNSQHHIGIVLSVSSHPHGIILERKPGSSRMIRRRQPQGQLSMINAWTTSE